MKVKIKKLLQDMLACIENIESCIGKKKTFAQYVKPHAAGCGGEEPYHYWRSCEYFA